MGWFGSSEEETEIKNVDTTGQVNNNVVIQNARDNHHQVLLDEKILFATHLLVAMKVLEMLIYAFHSLRKAFKRRYSKKNDSSV